MAAMSAFGYYHQCNDVRVAWNGMTSALRFDSAECLLRQVLAALPSLNWCRLAGS